MFALIFEGEGFSFYIEPNPVRLKLNKAFDYVLEEGLMQEDLTRMKVSSTNSLQAKIFYSDK